MSAQVHLLLGALAALLAGFVQGAAGFGFALVLTPLLLLLGGAAPAIFSSVVLGVPLSVAVVFETRRHLSWRSLRPLLIAATLSTPFGLLLLIALSGTGAHAMAASVALLGALLLVVRRPKAPRPEHRGRLLFLAGLLGGAINGATSMGGPPAALLVAAEGAGTQEARGLLSAFNLVSYALSSGALLFGHSVSGPSIREVLYWLPLAALGMFIGSRLARRAPEGAYPTIAASVAAGAAACALLSLLLP